jgi:hypothetical protein
MAITLSAFAAVEAGFARLTQAPAPLVFDARLVPGLPERTMPLDELRTLLVKQHFYGEVTDALWRQLAQHSREWGQPWMAAAAGIALPGLTGMAAKISRGHRRHAEDIDSEVLTGFLDALRHAPLDPPRVWLRLCWAAWRGGVAVIKAPDVEELTGDVPTGSRSPARPYGHPDLLLHRAFVAGVITKTQAELIGDTRFGDVLVEQIAAQKGVPASVIRMRRRRAERKVAAALGQGLLTVTIPAKRNNETDPDNLTALDNTPHSPDSAPLDPVSNAVTCTVRSGQVLSGPGRVHLS